MTYQILDCKGEIIMESITPEALQELLDSGEHNYFQYDDNPENDLVTHWTQHEEEGGDITNYRIYKEIIEE